MKKYTIKLRKSFNDKIIYVLNMTIYYALNKSTLRKVQAFLILTNLNEKYPLSKLRVIILTALFQAMFDT